MAKKRDRVKIVGIAVFLIVAVLSFLYAKFGWPFGETVSNQVNSEDSSVHFIDCGQGDSILIMSKGQTALVDAGTKDGGEAAIEYIEGLGIEKIDHFILTHPHADHIGGAAGILDSFNVGTVYMGKPTEGTEPTTAVYINLLKKIKEQEKTVVSTKAGDKIEIGDFTAKVLGPIEAYEERNDQSLVLRLALGKISFILTGDQEDVAEKGLLQSLKPSELKATVLKVGHHGSEGSTSVEFLKAISPQYAVISCGENSYGHPHQEVLDRIEQAKTELFRTDERGTIVMITDGNGLKVECEK